MKAKKFNGWRKAENEYKAEASLEHHSCQPLKEEYLVNHQLAHDLVVGEIPSRKSTCCTVSHSEIPFLRRISPSQCLNASDSDASLFSSHARLLDHQMVQFAVHMQ